MAYYGFKHRFDSGNLFLNHYAILLWVINNNLGENINSPFVHGVINFSYHLIFKESVTSNVWRARDHPKSI